MLDAGEQRTRRRLAASMQAHAAPRRRAAVTAWTRCPRPRPAPRPCSSQVMRITPPALQMALQQHALRLDVGLGAVRTDPRAVQADRLARHDVGDAGHQRGPAVAGRMREHRHPAQMRGHRDRRAAACHQVLVRGPEAFDGSRRSPEGACIVGQPERGRSSRAGCACGG